MNVRLPEDWVSAYHDGELTPSEREAAERQLQESPAARAELESYRRLSRLLSKLPVDVAPVELRHAVMLQAERSTLIPEAPTARPAASHDRPLAPKPFSRRWQSTGAVAASLMLIATTLVLWNNAPSPLPVAPPIVADHDVSRETSMFDATAAGTDMVYDASTMSMSADASTASTLVEEPATDAAMAMVTNGAAFETQDAAPPAPAAADNAENSIEIPREHRALDEIIRDRMDGDSQLLGDVFYYFPSGEESVAVLEMTVVDVRTTADKLQVLLQKHEVAVDPAALAQRQDKQAPVADANAADDGPNADDLVVVYVQATPEQLAATIGELGLESQVVDLALHPPLQANVEQLAAGDTAVWEQLDESLARGEIRSALEPSAVADLRARGLRGTSGAESKSAATKLETRSKDKAEGANALASTAIRKQIAEPSARRQSYQWIVPVPESRQAAQRMSKGNQQPLLTQAAPAVPASAAERALEDAVEARKPDAALKENAYARQAEVKVLFVFTRPRRIIDPPAETDADE